MKAVILAGGEGTRLRPLTLTTPKPVVPIVDRPFLRHQLDMLTQAGVSEVVFSLAYRPERIEAVFGDGRAHGKRIRYVVEETPLGTGGAVKNAEPHLDDVTIVFNGDVLTDVDLAGVVREHRASGGGRDHRARPPSPTRPPTAWSSSTAAGGSRASSRSRTRRRSRPTPSTPASTSSRPRPSS